MSRSTRLVLIRALALLTFWLGERFYRNYVWTADSPSVVSITTKPLRVTASGAWSCLLPAPALAAR